MTPKQAKTYVCAVRAAAKRAIAAGMRANVRVQRLVAGRCVFCGCPEGRRVATGCRGCVCHQRPLTPRAA